ncbi:MAG: hypothetical protein HZC40_13845 [Chloroflexi bacterium]|nr:hypothetical protein [Chloroflexota bacterium]
MDTHRLARFVITVLGIGFLVACASVSPTPRPTTIPASPTARPTFSATPLPTSTATATPSPTRTPTLTASQRYASAFGIDYAHPEKYIAQGEQTRLANPAIINALRGKPPSIAHLGEIYFWIKCEFTTWSAGGATIGAVTTDQLFQSRRLGGCHDWGLVYASIARELGYPVVMIDTAGIAWAKGFLAGKKSPYLGHVFVEVFVGGKWVLVDSTNNWYVEENYDPANAIIPLKMGDETEGLFVMRKGVDTWGYGIRSNAELTRLMEESARQLKIETIKFPPYNWQRFR